MSKAKNCKRRAAKGGKTVQPNTKHKTLSLPPWAGGPKDHTFIDLNTGKTKTLKREPLTNEQAAEHLASCEEALEVLDEFEGRPRRRHQVPGANSTDTARRGRVRIELVLSPEDERAIDYLLNWQGSTRTSIAGAALSRGLRATEEEVKAVFS